MLGLHEDTVQEWCRNATLPPEKRNARLPIISAFKRGKSWAVNVEATERAQAIGSGNPLEKDLIKMRKMRLENF